MGKRGGRVFLYYFTLSQKNSRDGVRVNMAIFTMVRLIVVRMISIGVQVALDATLSE